MTHKPLEESKNKEILGSTNKVSTPVKIAGFAFETKLKPKNFPYRPEKKLIEDFE